MGPGDLSRALAPLPRDPHPQLLIGRESFDDAGVYLLSDELALIQTVDFFPPIVDDPFTFGQIAAANALSDVYAMGGVPITALNIVAFPRDKLPLEVLTTILAGGQERVHSAGARIVGGHTVLDDGLKYGLAVTGTAHPARLLSNADGRTGDRLVLTKPLGTGLIATALKGDRIAQSAGEEMIASMITLNADAAAAALAVGARAATDVTGFGLLGHLSHIVRASNVSAVVQSSLVPVFTAARSAFEAGAKMGGAARNEDYLASLVTWAPTVDSFHRTLLADPQTSGGLLVCVPESRVREYLSRVPGSVEIGEIVDGPAGSITVA